MSNTKYVFNGEVLWCSPHSLSQDATLDHGFKVPLHEFAEFDQLLSYLDDIFFSSSRTFLVVLDASRNVTESFKQYELLHERYISIDVCMFYAKTFEPSQVWQFIQENIKPVLENGTGVSAHVNNRNINLTSQTNADE